IVINSYITGQQALFYAFFTVIKSFVSLDILELIPVLLAFIYALWFYSSFFVYFCRLSSFYRSMLTYILYLVFCFGSLIFSFAISKLF
ncbi:MAG: hypothetical protein KDC24_09880, partial [Saprospiraceae bacterium]|nr:hypothetical protein [Saprospiraceae bacterium]